MWYFYWIPDKENEEALWHILYSVEDKNEIVKALQKFADKHDLNASFVDVFQKFPPFKKEYGSYSAKQLKIIAFNAYGKILEWEFNR